MLNNQAYFGAVLFLQEENGWWLRRSSLTQWEDRPLEIKFSPKDKSWDFVGMTWFDEALPAERLSEKFDRIFLNKTHKLQNGQRVPVSYPPLFEIFGYEVVTSGLDPNSHKPIAYLNAQVKAKTIERDFIDKNRHVRYHLFNQEELETLMYQFGNSEDRKEWCRLALAHSSQ
jgi:hypothetical protein